MKKNYIILSALAAASLLCGIVVWAGSGKLSVSPFDRTFTYENPSYGVVDADGNSYVIDQSMRRVVKIDGGGNVKWIISGGEKGSRDFFYAYEIAVDADKNLYLLNGVLDDEGFFMQREEILKYSADGHFDSVLYSKSYGPDERKPTLVQRGQLSSLRADKDVVEWFDIDSSGIQSSRVIQSKGAVERRTEVNLPDASLLVSDVDRCPDGSVVFSTKKGKILKSVRGKAPAELYSADDRKDAVSMPWWVAAGSDGSIYFTDLGTRSVMRITKSEPKTVLSKEIIEKAGMQTSSFVYYRISISENGTVCSCNDYYCVALSSDGQILKYSDGGRYASSVVICRLFIWFCLIAGILLAIGALFVLHMHILKRRLPLMAKQVLIFVPMVVVAVAIPSKLIIDDFSGRYKSELDRKISSMVQMAPLSIDADDITTLSKNSDYMGESYMRLRTQLLKALNYNRDDWNRGFYFVLYRVIDDKLYGCMYLNGGIGLYYPFNSFDDSQSIYRKAYKGEVVTESLSDVWGSWLYGVGPIYGSDGKVVALIEVGTDLYSFNRENSRMIVRMILRLCVITVVFICLLMAVTYFLLVSLRRLRNGVTKLSQGEWDTKVNIGRRHDEVADLAEGFNKMSTYILNYINEIVSLNNGYHRFVPEQFLVYLEKDNVTQIQLGDQVQKVMTVMFSDIRSFTTLSEKMTPKENFDFLNSYLKEMGPVIRNNKGFIDKYIGDAIMALFPFSPDDAMTAALGMFEQLSAFNAERVSRGEDPIAIGLGLHTGSLMLGVIGEAERMDGTVISDNVNFASRLEGLTKHYGAMMLISDTTYDALQFKDRYLVRNLGKVKVKGKNEPMAVYEVLNPLPPDEKSMKMKTRDVLEKGILLYQAKRFDEANERFSKILAVDKHDKVALRYQGICNEMKNSSASQIAWDGTMEMREK